MIAMFVSCLTLVVSMHLLALFPSLPSFNVKGRMSPISIDPTIDTKTPGTYELSDSQVTITYDWNGQKLELKYSYDSAKNVLCFDSGDPNHPALYRMK